MVGSALAEVVNETGVDRGYNVTAEATSGSQENIRRLASGELDFALSNAAITYFAIRGGEGWDRAYPVRSVMTLAPNVALFVTQSSSGITALSDLQGRRVTVGPAGAGLSISLGHCWRRTELRTTTSPHLMQPNKPLSTCLPTVRQTPHFLVAPYQRLQLRKQQRLWT